MRIRWDNEKGEGGYLDPKSPLHPQSAFPSCLPCCDGRREFGRVYGSLLRPTAPRRPVPLCDCMLVIVPTVFEAVHLLGEGVREPLLADGVARAGVGDSPPWTVATCGFGLASSGIGALTAMLAHGAAIGGGALRRAVLVGISGTFDTGRAPIGAAVVGTEAVCEGIGAGTGDGFVAASTMGWSQGHARSWLPACGDRAELATPDALRGLAAGPILSVAAASGDVPHRNDRAARHPDAIVEEMEGYAVALAARLCRVELTIIRGVSDLVGDRNPANWEVPRALSAVRMALTTLAGDPAWQA